MLDIINWFIKKIKQEKNNKKNKVDFLEVGDVIWARRYRNEEEKSKIKKGHEIGPYIIIKKDEDKVYGIYCSSNPLVYNQIIKRKLNKLDYTSNKDNYIWINYIEEITPSMYLNTVGKVDDEKIDLINKYIYIGMNHNYEIKNYYLDDITFNYNIGDVIIYKNQKYYIYKLDNNNYYCYKLNNNYNNNQQSIEINKKQYSLNFNSVPIPITSNIDLYDVLDIDTQNIINKLKIKKQEEEKSINNLESGNLIEYNNKLYYIYGNYKDYLLTHQIYKNKTKNSHKITINQEVYYIDLKETKIKKENYRIKVINRISTIEELELKRIKKEIKNSTEEKQHKQNEICKKFIIKTVIANKETLDRYIIIDRNDNIITVYSIKDKKIFSIDLNKDNELYTKLEILSNLSYQNVMIKIKKRVNDRLN